MSDWASGAPDHGPAAEAHDRQAVAMPGRSGNHLMRVETGEM